MFIFVIDIVIVINNVIVIVINIVIVIVINNVIVIVINIVIVIVINIVIVIVINIVIDIVIIVIVLLLFIIIIVVIIVIICYFSDLEFHWNGDRMVQSEYEEEEMRRTSVPFISRFVRCISCHGNTIYWGDDGTNLKMLQWKKG